MEFPGTLARSSFFAFWDLLFFWGPWGHAHLLGFGCVGLWPGLVVGCYPLHLWAVTNLSGGRPTSSGSTFKLNLPYQFLFEVFCSWLLHSDSDWTCWLVILIWSQTVLTTVAFFPSHTFLLSLVLVYYCSPSFWASPPFLFDSSG